MKRLFVFVFAVVLFVGCGPEAPRERKPRKVDYFEHTLNNKDFQSIREQGQLLGTWKIKFKKGNEGYLKASDGIEDYINWLDIYKIENEYTIVEMWPDSCIFEPAVVEDAEKKGYVNIIPKELNDFGEYYRIKKLNGAMVLYDEDGDNSRGSLLFMKYRYDPSLL